MRSSFAVSILFITLFLSGCGGEASNSGKSQDGSNKPGERISVDGGTFTRLSPVELREMKEEENFPLVNVHIPFAGNIPGTDLSIPYNEIEENLEELPADKDAKIVLYCRSGPMSTEAAGTLVRLGYTNVWELDGGMEAWRRAGFKT